MAMAQPKTALLTYEQYMAEDEINLRYDIIDGKRIFMSSPTDEHQDILLNLGEIFRAYQRQSHQGKVTVAPRDILIRRAPLKTRQPDVMFISAERHALNPPRSSTAPTSPAPELVVEIVSSSERERILNGKISDYCAVDVLECWVVRPPQQTVEVMRLSAAGAETIATYGVGEIAVSLTFPGLQVPVAEIFAE